ncbi:hypothetical protein ACFQT4_21580 [Pseudoduganella danionis]|uniref:hypothetical protein n=1 Tax=Pseudoduganella danionis TaxID=1890295 RepID=UPI0036164199
MISISDDSGLGSESSTMGRPMATPSASAMAPTRRRRARFFSGSIGSSASRSRPPRPLLLADEARLERARSVIVCSSALL